MTPTEVNGRLKAHQAQRNMTLEQYDSLAWMIGSYAARGYHSPKSYPKKPVFTTIKKQNDMTSDDMKSVMRNFADRHNKEVSANGHNP